MYPNVLRRTIEIRIIRENNGEMYYCTHTFVEEHMVRHPKLRTCEAHHAAVRNWIDEV